MSLVRTILAHPLTRGLNIDDPQTTVLRRRIIRDKPFLFRIYQEWYAGLIAALPSAPGAVLELGSGAGFLAEILPEVITSEVFHCPGISVVADAQQLPFADQSLRAIVMSDVLHHIPQPRRFFTEAARCIRPGGVIAMIEPWVTPWSSFIYTKLHHEPFDPQSPDWHLPPGGPLSAANGAMPWIIFHRDREQFEKEFPQWELRQIEPCMPLRYLLSGGVSLRALVPQWTFPLWKTIEQPLCRHAGMFAKIILTRRG